MSSIVGTQWVCTSAPVCLCTGSSDDCDCQLRCDVLPQCEACGAPMWLIDLETGEPVSCDHPRLVPDPLPQPLAKPDVPRITYPLEHCPDCDLEIHVRRVAP